MQEGPEAEEGEVCEEEGEEVTRGLGRVAGLVIGVSVFLLLSMLIASAGASANSAQLTKSQANPSWTRASLAGSITWDSCVAGRPCSWAAFATVYPLKFDECGLPGQFNEFVRTIPLGPVQSANGTVSFKMTNVPIVEGIYGQLLCLFVTTDPNSLPPDCLGSDFELEPEQPCAEDYQIFRRGLSGRNPCKRKKQKAKKRIARKASRALTVAQYRKKFCPKK